MPPPTPSLRPLLTLYVVIFFWLYLAIFGLFRCHPMYLSPGRKARAAHTATAAASARS
jgi:hypothetical protein